MKFMCKDKRKDHSVQSDPNSNTGQYRTGGGHESYSGSISKRSPMKNTSTQSRKYG